MTRALSGYLLFMWTCIIPLHGFSQEDYIWSMWSTEKGKTATVFMDMANVRESPAANAPIVDSLTMGSTVSILSDQSNVIHLRGFDAPWVQIRYKNNQVGFIWCGALALGAFEDSKQQLTYLYGLHWAARNANDILYYRVGIKLLDSNNQLVDKKEFNALNYDQNYAYAKLLGDMGLMGVQNILRIAFSGEACGIPTDYYYYAWNGQEFLALPNKSSVSDAGVFYHDETLLFPAEHKGANTLIIKNTEDGEAEETDDYEDLKFKVKKKSIRYHWDGKVATVLP